MRHRLLVTVAADFLNCCQRAQCLCVFLFIGQRTDFIQFLVNLWTQRLCTPHAGFFSFLLLIFRLCILHSNRGNRRQAIRHDRS